MTKVFSIVRQTCGRSTTDDLKGYTENLRSTENQPFKSVRQLFQTTGRLITDQAEIIGLTTIDWKQLMRRETTPLCERAVQIASSKTYAFPTQCSVWEPSVINQSKPGKTGSNGFFGNTLSQRFGSNRRRADGVRVEISQDSPRWEFSTRFKR